MPTLVGGAPGGQVMVSEAAPLRVSGTIAIPGGTPVSVNVLLGNGEPLEQVIAVPGRGAPRIALGVALPRALEILPRTADLNGTQPLLTLQSALARAAVAWQYGQFLASPDQEGSSSASYVYRTAAPGPVVVPAGPSRGGGGHTLAIVFAATLGAGALLGLAVLWAHQ